ncbi:MAG: 4'-phosphopantetheinyl transferase superfamily protein [Flavipsychrobacter sp.]|nr:4'-phosphopantetheinyl transferase superfamily protein [Flavipsychrobacter sp.]
MTGKNHLPYQNIELANGFAHIYMHIIGVMADDVTVGLSADELRRAGEHKLATDRKRYIQAHLFFRKVLSSYINTAPSDIVFSYTDYGQPLLVQKPGEKPVYFNISYCGTRIMVGVSSYPIGVDIELIRDIDTLDMDGLSQTLFSAGERRYLQLIDDLQEKREYFFKVWTLKEAFIKGMGTGVSYGLQRFTALPGMGSAAPVLLCNEKGWVLKQLNSESYAAAAAIHINL